MTDTLFVFNPSSDPQCEDDEYVLLANMDISVQVCAHGGATTFAVNEHGQDDPADDDTFWVRDHGQFRTLKAAKEKALEIAKSRKQ